jgi:hypothetical protein
MEAWISTTNSYIHKQYIYIYCNGIWPFARQRIGKHCLKAGIAAEAEVILLGNGSLAPVSAATNINKNIPVTTKQNNRRQLTVGHGDIFGARGSYKTELIRAPPCGGGVEYLHRDPASRRRRRKGKSRNWDSKIWPRVLWDSDPKMTALARASSNCKRQTSPLVREGAPNY